MTATEKAPTRAAVALKESHRRTGHFSDEYSRVSSFGASCAGEFSQMEKNRS